MDYHQKLLSKNGISTMTLAKEFLLWQIGEKIPTVSDLKEKVGLARGTIQNSIKFLQENDAIRLESKGHLGTFLIAKNTSILLAFAGITSIVGVMPLPYSKRYEGFATGLIVAMENQFNLPASMAYMRGATNRIAMLLADRYDFAIVSRYAANNMMKKNDSIQIVKAFGRHSYLSEHVIVFHDANCKAIEDGMKIGIDNDSIDQRVLTENACTGKRVEFVHVEYNQILEKVMSGELDAAIWNEDEITDKRVHINYVVLPSENSDDTEAVMVVNAKRHEMAGLLRELIDTKVVLDNQKLVLEGKITPSY